MLCYLIAILLELFYLKGEFNETIELPYLLRLIMTLGACFFLYLGSKITTIKILTAQSEIQIWNRFTFQLIFFLYGILLFNMVIFSRYQVVTNVNLIPFRTILDQITGSYSLSYQCINLLGNFFVFMPIPYFLSTIWNFSKKKTFLVTGGILVAIEVIQYFFHCGVADIDDILLSGLGCLFVIFFLKSRKNDH